MYDTIYFNMSPLTLINTQINLNIKYILKNTKAVMYKLNTFHNIHTIP